MQENSVLHPISHYAAAKMASEAFITSYSNMYGIRSFICRLPSVIGEHMTHGTLYDWSAKIKINPKLLTVLGDGKQSKPFMYVRDLIDAMLFIYDNAKDNVNVFNISGEGYTTIEQLAKMFIVSKRLDTEIVYQGNDRGWVGDIPKYRCNIDKIKSLGWKPSRTSNDTVELTLSKL